MKLTTIWAAALCVGVIAVPAVPAAAAPAAAAAAAAAPAGAAPTAAPTASVYSTTDRLARQLAGQLHSHANRERVLSAAASGAFDLTAVALGPTFARSARLADDAVNAAKGLPAGVPLLQARLADPSMLTALRRGVTPLVAATPTDDQATSLIGYDPAGHVVRVDATRRPDRPVLLVEVDTAKALPLGVKVLRQRLAGRSALAAQATTGYWATKVDAVRLTDDEEPWFKGAAEIYSVVGGFGLDGAAKADIVQMPYLDDDGTTYYPNQLLVHFNAYKYNLADVVMMEDDGDTNYLQLAQAIAAALLTIADAGTYVPLVSAILAAMPSSWWTDDPDYVDSWYTLSTASSGRLNGAAGNGWMDVSPYFVQPL